MGSLSEEDSTRKRTPRKRASRSGVRATRNTTTRKAVSKKETSKSVEKEERVSKTSERKAPTPIASSKVSKKKKRKQQITAFAVLGAGVVFSAVVGFTDKGQIDVQRTIEERNERIRTGNLDETDVNVETVAVPVQNTSNKGKADGGLVGAGKRTPAPPPVVVASTTATSSEQTASSTDATATSSEDVPDAVVEEEVDSSEEDEPTDPEV